MDSRSTQPPVHRARAEALDDVVAWRQRRLLEAGFPDQLCRSLAASNGVDVHLLLQLVDRGCPPELAARILSPLQDGAS